MLKELQIKNFAIIDDISIKFSNGFNVLTGETGVGKTLVIEAINILLGERASTELIRDNEEKLIVQGFFDLSKSPKAIHYLKSEKLIENIDEASDIFISREVTKLGKNRSFINGIFIQVSTLKRLGSFFLDLHGQHDHQYLLDWQTHIDIIDAFGGENALACLNNYKLLYQEYINLLKSLKQLIKLKKDKEFKTEDLHFRINEIEKLELKENEEENLEEQKNILKNYEKIFYLCSESINLLNNERQESKSIVDDISKITKNLEELSKIDKKFERYFIELGGFFSIINELNDFLKDYIENLEFNAEKLDWVQERLFKISEIKKKYGLSIEEIKKYLIKLKNELDGFANLDYQIEELKIQFKNLKEKLVQAAIELSNKRSQTINNFTKEVKNELKDLNFKSVEFVVKHNLNVIESEQKKDSLFCLNVNNNKVWPNNNGIDNIEFLISLNKGETPKKLEKIASGGEISRIMLALKSLISGIDNIITMVFDEIDVGIGGQTALIVGKKLYNISKNCQVICITHLPQIAAFADSHYYIEKATHEERTIIKIKNLKEINDRIKEISRMLSGLTKSEISLMHAKELLKEAEKIKSKNKYINGEKIRIGN